MEAHFNQTFNVVTPFYTRAMILRAWRGFALTAGRFVGVAP
jgi:hypothetical protein